MIWRPVIFIVLTGFLVFVSRASLLAPRTHGFHRFFAWEAMAALLLLNIEYWFADPFGWHQIIAWVLLLASIVPLTAGVVQLRRAGQPSGSRRAEPELLAFERTSHLVTTGIYKYIRHPLYCSLLLLTWGVFFKHPSSTGLGLAAIATFLLVLTARADEQECRKHFGQQYAEYMRRTRRFIPFVV